MPLTGVEGDYVAPAARDTYFSQEPNLIAPFDFDYDACFSIEFTSKRHITPFSYKFGDPPESMVCLSFLLCKSGTFPQRCHNI